MHRCDNPRCVNPTHLQWGTFQENTEDCRRKGRLAPQIIARVRAEQEANHWSKGKSRRLLSPEAVHLIRNSKRKTGYLAKRMGVAEQTIRHIRAGRTYKDV